MNQQLSNRQNNLTVTETKALYKALLPHLATLVAIIAPLLYIVGRAYNEGYLAYWGLPAQVFAIDKELSVVMGLFAYIRLLIDFFPEYTYLLIIITFALYVVMFSSIKRVNRFFSGITSKAKEALAPKLKDHLVITETHDKLLNYLTIILGVLIIPLFVVLLFSYSTEFAAKKGKDAAEKKHKEFISGRGDKKPFGSKVSIVTKVEEKERATTYSGYLISTSTTHCAIFDDSRGVLIFPFSEILRIQIQENK